MRSGRALLLLGLLATVACGEEVESSYRTYRDAVADDAIARGWLPAWLPSTATDIREWHDLDTNATFASFRYGSAAPREFLAPCAPVSQATALRGSRWRPPDSERSRLRFYRCDEKVVYGDGRVQTRAAWAAIDEGSASAYFWR